MHRMLQQKAAKDSKSSQGRLLNACNIRVTYRKRAEGWGTEKETYTERKQTQTSLYTRGKRE